MSLLLALYGLLFFVMNAFYYDFPKGFRIFQQAIYTILEYLIFSYIFFTSIQNSKVKQLIKWTSLLFLSFILLYYYISRAGRIDSIPVGVESILIFCYCFFYFKQAFENTTIEISKNVNFILIIGILIYLGTSFFLNILANNISKEAYDKYWHYTYLPEVVKNVLFAYAVFGYQTYSVGINKEKLPKVGLKTNL